MIGKPLTGFYLMLLCQTQAGRSVLHYAAYTDQAEVMEELLRRGGEADAKSKDWVRKQLK